MFAGLAQDLRLGVRALGRSPGLVVAAVLILALGIGANTTVFTVVNSCFFASPPHVVEPERLVRANLATHMDHSRSWSFPDYVFFRDHSSLFAGMCAYEPTGMALTATTGEGKRSVSARYVSDSYFSVLGIRPAAGRLFGPEEGRAPGASAVVVISHGLWQSHFGGDAEATGAHIRLNGHTYTIVGVTPEHFGGSSPVESAPDLYVPLMMQPMLSRTSADWLNRVPDEYFGWLTVLARLEPNVTLEAAQAEIDALETSLEEAFPAPKWATGGQRVVLSPHFQYDPRVRGRLLSLTRMLMAVVGFVLLIACANVALLLLTRASARSRDIGVQVALGARRGRILRQLLVESLLLASAGGAAGFLLAFWSADLVAQAFPFSFSTGFRPDLSVLAFTVSVAVGAAVFFGVAPALAAARADVVTLIRSRESGGTRSPLHSLLVVTQVALSIVLVAGSVQFARSLHNAQSVDLGFETESRLLVSLNLTNHGYSQEDIRRFVVVALERLEAVPGVSRASTTLQTPFRGGWGSRVWREGEAEGEARPATFNSVSPGYLSAMGIPLLAGRDFTLHDDIDAPRVAIINEAAARTLWPEDDAVGQSFVKSDERVTVVGVARNAKYHELSEQAAPHIYVPALQPFATFTGSISFLVQATSARVSVARSVQEAIQAIDPDLAFTSVQTMEECVERAVGRYRVGATVVGLFGLVALILAAVGLYGVLSFLVVRRTRIIGIKMALGATRGRVARSVLGHGLKLSLLGMVIGIPMALASSRFVESFLYGVSPEDPVTFSVAPLVLTAVASLAGFLPAHRASRLDPMEALREE